jgi:hypothetical protein
MARPKKNFSREECMPPNTATKRTRQIGNPKGTPPCWRFHFLCSTFVSSVPLLREY